MRANGGKGCTFRYKTNTANMMHLRPAATNMTRLRRLFVLLLLPCAALRAQTVDTAQVSAATQLIDLSFRPAEKDSMLDGVRSAQRNYQKMHQHNLLNNQPYPLSFHPAPAGYSIPVKQLPVAWNIPANVSLPANRDELAFYTVAEL